MEKIIFQTWKSKTDIPPNLAKWSATWKECHPRWTYLLWDDKDDRDFVVKEYPQYLQLYDSFPEQIYRVDMVRYLFLHRFGGLYADMDYECLRPFDDLVDSIDEVVILGRMGDDTSYEHSIPNALMIAKHPGDPFWLHVMETLQQTAKWRRTPEGVTGPMMLKRAVDSYEGRLAILPKRFFYPIDWHDVQDRRLIRAVREGKSVDIRAVFPGSYAVTYWTHFRDQPMREWFRSAVDQASGYLERLFRWTW